MASLPCVLSPPAAAPCWTQRVLHLGLTDTTMRPARALARAGAAEGTSVVARAQWDGRGRRGRAWASPVAAGLYLTCVLRPPPGRAVAQLALVAGYAVWRAARLLGAARSRLKWPNDVCLADGRKLAGILLEAEGAAVLVGIGLNLAAAADAGGGALPRRYVGLRELTAALPGGEAGRLAALHALLPALRAAYRRWLAEGLAPLCRAWPAADALHRRRVRAEGPRGPLRGRALGLASDGRLRLATRDGLHLVAAGEVHTVRRVRRGRRAAAVARSE